MQKQHARDRAGFDYRDVQRDGAGPPPTITMGLGVGSLSGGTCSVQSPVSAQAGTTAQLSGPLDAGSYCVDVFDVGNQAAPVTYTVTVAHP